MNLKENSAKRHRSTEHHVTVDEAAGMTEVKTSSHDNWLSQVGERQVRKLQKVK